MNTTLYDDGFIFQFIPSAEKRSLRSVAINSYGEPELRFDISSHTPSLTEEDVGTICRLVSEGKRPNFTYHAIDESHPFYGRQYMIYDPPWLKGTSVGEALAEVDWKMKCLNVGAQTDKTKRVFYSREKASTTRGLATFLDFADDNPDSPGFIFTRCAGVTVQTYDDEMVFCNDPKLRIDYYKSSTYSEYITRVLPLIAEHDEPAFVQLQEMIKMILAAEWLKEKSIEMSEKWMKACTRENRAVAIPSSDHSDHGQLVSDIKNSIGKDIPTIDISMNAEEKKKSKQAVYTNANYYYGWYDNGSGEMVQFSEDGECYKEYQSLRTYNESVVIIDGKKVDETVWLANFGILLPKKLRIKDVWELKKDLVALKEHHEGYALLGGPISIDTEVKSSVEEKGNETFFTADIRAAGCSGKFTITVRESTSDWNFIYHGLNPQKTMMPIPNVPNTPVVPEETSWNELYSQTVPWPRVWLSQPDGPGVLSAAGGVRTDVIPRTEIPCDHGARKAADQYSSVVAARHHGSIQLLSSKDAEQTSKQFRESWIGEDKGPCPNICGVFAITNFGLEQKWKTYRSKLVDKTVESYFHGTALKCAILETAAFCPLLDCGICGISDEGFKHISDSTFQRFGKGFYLAPNSSKCNDYTEPFTTARAGIAYRAQLLCDVCPGKKRILTNDARDLREPPKGFNSVFGQAAEGGALNYSEIVIYKKDSAAIRPRYIIVYDKK